MKKITDQGSALLKITLAMFIFGTIGIFVRHIPFPSGSIAFFRGIMGTIFLLAVMFISKKKPDFSAIKKNLLLLIISGVFIGINWILLFEAYRFATVATATLCYYLSPVFVILASPLALGEKLTLKKIVCILCALMGIVLVSGVAENGIVGGKIEPVKDPNENEIMDIIGETFIKVKKTYSYTFDGSVAALWSVDKKYPVTLTFDPNDPRNVSLKWESSYSGQFDLYYGDYKKTIVVESLF